LVNSKHNGTASVKKTARGSFSAVYVVQPAYSGASVWSWTERWWTLLSFLLRGNCGVEWIKIPTLVLVYGKTYFFLKLDMVV